MQLRVAEYILQRRRVCFGGQQSRSEKQTNKQPSGGSKYGPATGSNGSRLEAWVDSFVIRCQPPPHQGRAGDRSRSVKLYAVEVSRTIRPTLVILIPSGISSAQCILLATAAQRRAALPAGRLVKKRARASAAHRQYRENSGQLV